MKASVLIANFNGEKYIEECIESLYNQTFKEFEIIIFDDCSTDNSINIIKKYKNIKLIENIHHTEYGSFNQMNAYRKAFDISSGEIIFTLDSDDYFYPNKIESVLNYFKSDIKIAFDLPTIVQKKKKNNFYNKSKKFRLSCFPFFTQQSCMSAKREIFLDLMKMTNYKIFKDVWFDFRASLYAKYKFKKLNIIDEHLTYYRLTQTNVSSKFKHLSKFWWKRRLDYHKYDRYYCDKNYYNYSYSLDYIVTKLINYYL